MRTDAMLWEAARSGDVNAFGAIFDRHHRQVYNFAFRLTASWAAAEDVTSEAFLTAWRRRMELAPRGESALPLLLGIAKKCSDNASRSARRQDRLVRHAAQPEAGADVGDDVAERLAEEQTMGALLVALSRLRPIEQELVHLCLWTGLTYQEAADATGRPIGTVRSTLSRAKEKLRRDPELLASAGHDMGNSSAIETAKGSST